MKDWDTVKSADNWAHLHPQILSTNGTEHYVDKSLDPEKQEEILGELNTNDEPAPRLRDIGSDIPLNPKDEENPLSNWVIREYGDLTKFQDGAVCYGVVCLKNQRWPGAYTVGNYNGWANIYIGYGQKEIQEPFLPV